MIDFRYHLVSLISVFLALAVGVVLGAGPLQNSLGTALNDQVTSLRENRKAMQTQLEQTEAAVNNRDDYMADLHRQHPQYGWVRNAGYPTREHRAAIAEHGPTPFHRRSFRLLPD